jgi:tetratricopeptide (TPR) repeat protein
MAFEAPKLESLGQYTRLQIPVTSGTTFRLLSAKGGEATLVVDRVATGALEGLASLSDGRVKEVRAKALGLDKAEITVRFQDPATESFAYQQGNTLVLDLWRSEGKNAGPPPTLPDELPKQEKKIAARVAAHTGRAPASAKPPQAVPRIQVQPLRIGTDLFQKFLLPMPELRVSSKEGTFDLPPKIDLGERWKFSAGDKETEEGRGYEFAKQLFTAKKYGLCLKTIEILRREHPTTKYSGELELLGALSYRKLGEATKADYLVERSEKLLEELAARRNEEGHPLPFGRLIVLHFAAKELEAGNWLKAIQHLEYVASTSNPKDAEFPYAQMLLAESYSKLNQPRRAERLYRYLTEKYPGHILAKEAYYRIADLLAQEKNYARVIEEGEAAIQAYPAYEKTRAEVLFHIGEACFWLGQYAKAEKYLRRFTVIASAHTNASLAWVRLGEIAEISRSSLSSAHEDYLRAKNGYPFSRGDLVATVRLARIDLPKERQPEFVVRTLKELLRDKTMDWDLRRMAELTLADYLTITGAAEEAIALSSAGLAHTDGIVYNLYKRAYENGLFLRFTQLTRDKKYAEALLLYDHDKKWLEEYGPETYRTAAEIYRGLGLYASSNKLMETYRGELARSKRGPASVTHAVQLSEDEAANSFARGAYADALRELPARKGAMSSYIRAVSHFRLGQKQEAYLWAERALPLAKETKPEFTGEMIENLAEILIDRGNAERDFRRMEKDVALARAQSGKENEVLQFAAADALWYQKRHKEAARAYQSALEKYPGSLRLERGRYNLAMCLLALGKRDEAVKLLTELRDSSQSVWAESARQELELIDWEKKYSSVLRTLPPSGLGIMN